MTRKDRKYHGQFGIPFSKIHLDRELAYVVPLKYRLLIGIVGPKFSGKTVVTSHLVENLGYRFYSLSTFVKEEAHRLSLPLDDRLVLKREGDRLRREFGRDVLARRAVQSIRRDLVERQEPVTHIVIDGIKNSGEVQFLERLPGVAIIGVTASTQCRYERAQQLGFTGGIEEFMEEIDGPDSNSADDCGQEVQICLSMVDQHRRITNDGRKPDLIDNIDAILREIGGIPT